MAAIKNVKLKVDTSSLKSLEDQLGGLQRAVNAQNAIWRRVCTRVTPLVRRLLSDSLSLSGLKTITGEMKNAVAQAIIYPTSKGLKIGLPRGKSADFYAKAGALQYGAIHRAESSNKRVRRKLKLAGLASGYRPGAAGSYV